MTFVSRSLSAVVVALASLAACAKPPVGGADAPAPVRVPTPRKDARVGLRAGFLDAGQAAWNLRLLSSTPPLQEFLGVSNSDLAFIGRYAIQGNYNGIQVWDISSPQRPRLATAFLCPASQSDVSVYRNLLFVSGEGLEGRLDCGTQGVKDTVSKDRLRGLRIFDISDLNQVRNVGNVQTCRGSHTHSVLVDPRDTANVYVYISGSSRVRSPDEMPGCVALTPDKDPNSALFRIEVIKVPLAHPERAAIVSSPRLFNDLAAVTSHAETPEDIAAARKAAADARKKGQFTAEFAGIEYALSPTYIDPMLDSIVAARGGRGAPTRADSATLRAALQSIVDRDQDSTSGPTQCHDITLYPDIGLAAGACEGYGMLIDIRDPTRPVRISAVADSNFAYWHSATFNNDGSKVLFSDEWGGGGSAKCRATDKREWGADAIFTVDAARQMKFQSYYKLPAPQSITENCVAHNGSLIPIPGRDVMVQGWYQGGISVFDWTDPARPVEIAYFDRGPIHPTERSGGGSWSAYWYNGVIVSSEIFRGLDVLELTPSDLLTKNEIDAAKTVVFTYFNAQGQQKLVWPPSFALARAYIDQIERASGLDGPRISSIRQALDAAELLKGVPRAEALAQLVTRIEAERTPAPAGARIAILAAALRDLAAASR